MNKEEYKQFKEEEFKKLKVQAHEGIDTLQSRCSKGISDIGTTIGNYISRLELMNIKTKDDYHSMDELYHHRTILFAYICSQSNNAWKSLRHSDDTKVEDGWFIAGLETEFGQITYHQKIDYWRLFKCKELDKAPEFDGHMSDDVVNRFIELINKVK